MTQLNNMKGREPRSGPTQHYNTFWARPKMVKSENLGSFWNTLRMFSSLRKVKSILWVKLYSGSRPFSYHNMDVRFIKITLPTSLPHLYICQLLAPVGLSPMCCHCQVSWSIQLALDKTHSWNGSFHCSVEAFRYSKGAWRHKCIFQEISETENKCHHYSCSFPWKEYWIYFWSCEQR